MTAIRQQDELELVYTGSPDGLPAREEHNLGVAIFLMAINDYCSTEAGLHEDARCFLFPATAERQEAFDWAASLIDKVHTGWLREGLNRSRFSWDVKRSERSKRRSQRRKLKLEGKAYGLKTNMEQEPAAVVVRGDGVDVQQPCTADPSGVGDAAAHV